MKLGIADVGSGLTGKARLYKHSCIKRLYGIIPYSLFMRFFKCADYISLKPAIMTLSGPMIFRRLVPGRKNAAGQREGAGAAPLSKNCCDSILFYYNVNIAEKRGVHFVNRARKNE